MFGREPRLPVDVEFGLTPHTTCSGRFVDNLRQRLRQAHDLAKKHSRLAADRNKRYYDVKKREARLEQGDRVLVRNCTPTGKLDNKWEQHVYVIKDKPNESIPVYRLVREDGKGRTRTLHRNLILPCPNLESCSEDPSGRQVVNSKGRRPAGRRNVSNNTELQDDCGWSLRIQGPTADQTSLTESATGRDVSDRLQKFQPSVRESDMSRSVQSWEQTDLHSTGAEVVQANGRSLAEDVIIIIIITLLTHLFYKNTMNLQFRTE